MIGRIFFSVFLTLFIPWSAVSDMAKPSSQNKALTLSEEGGKAADAKDFITAEKKLKLALSIDKNCVPAVFNLAGVFMATNRHEDAIELLKKHINTKKSNAGLSYRLGEAYLATKKNAEAEEAFLKVLEIDPRYPKLYQRLATVFLLENKIQEAHGALEKALDQEPSNAKVSESLASLYLALGRYEDAIQMAKRSLAAQPTASAYTTAGLAYEAVGNLQDSLIALRRAIDLDSSNESLHKKVAEIEKRLKLNEGKKDL